jgi:CelD/BcsL family acetyltransferase involved in cellulose biosynthesis
MSNATSFDAVISAEAETGEPAAASIGFTTLDREAILALDAAQWDRLACESLSENPFHSRMQVVAALKTVDRGKKLRALAFHAADGKLVGLFLFQPHYRVPTPFPVANGLVNNYLLNGVPLVHRDYAPAVVSAWLNAVKSGKAAALWAFADVHLDAPLIALMRQGAEARGLAVATALPYERAFLTRIDGGLEAHLKQVLSKSRLANVRRTSRRLSEAGTIELEHVEEKGLFEQRLEQFLALEHAGWKGAMGTSLLSNDTDAAFARQAYRVGLAAMDSLLLDGKPIAMKLSIRTGGTAFMPKIAYDEGYRNLAPGMTLEYKLVEDFYASDRLEAVDAAATAKGHAMLDFFNNQRPMALLIIGRHAWQVSLLAHLHRLREASKLKLNEMKQKLAEWRPDRKPENPTPADPQS